MDPVHVVVIAPVSDAALARIAAVDDRVRVTDARGWFDGEMRDTWPEQTARRYLPKGGSPPPRAVRDAALTQAEVVLGAFPFVRDLRARAPRLRWFHQTPAGASNLRQGDLWGSDVIATTSRAHADSLRPIAEYALAALLHMARGFPHAARERQRHAFDHRAYRPALLAGKTVCVVGAGGIGREVARLCAGIGMRVVGTRRTVTAAGRPPDGFDRIEPADRLFDLLPESDAVVVCCQWTPETTNLIDRAAFAAMKPGAMLVNVARGEIVDEEALIEALAAGRLRGVALDVYVGEFERDPDRRLWDDERVLITPHISGGTDMAAQRPIDLFCDNLRAYLGGRPLANVIDWARGY